jgi:threonine aldolase
VADCDSVMFCVSKGLSAPVGSLLCGSEEFIHEARRVRKALGGGMRQAGVLAAAGLVALDMVERLDEDHAHARRLAEGLTRIPQLAVHPVETNMVLADVSATGLTGTHFAELMHDAGVGCLPRDMGPTARFVTHRHITSADIDEVVRRIKAVFVDLAGAP